MKRLLFLLVLSLILASPVSAKSSASITASPDTVALGDSVNLTWGNLPRSGAALEVVTPCFDAIEVFNLYSNSSGSFQTTSCSGEWVFEIVRNDRVLDSAVVTVN